MGVEAFPLKSLKVREQGVLERCITFTTTQVMSVEYPNPKLATVGSTLQEDKEKVDRTLVKLRDVANLSKLLYVVSEFLLQLYQRSASCYRLDLVRSTLTENQRLVNSGKLSDIISVFVAPR